MSPGALGWAFIVVGSLIVAAGGFLVFVGQQMVSNPKWLAAEVVTAAEEPEPVLNPQQHMLLERIWKIQSELGLEYLVVGMHGRLHFDDKRLREQHQIDLNVEVLRGGPTPEGTDVDPGFEALLDGMPEHYFTRLDRQDRNKYMRIGRFGVVSVTEAGIRYLRNE